MGLYRIKVQGSEKINGHAIVHEGIDSPIDRTTNL